MSVHVRDFLKARRDRALGTILGWSEQNLYKAVCPKCGTPRMPSAVQERFRQKVFDAMNAYHDTILDLLKSEDGIRNDRVIDLLEQLHGQLEQSELRTRVHSQPSEADDLVQA